MGLKDNIAFAIKESDRIEDAVPFMTLVELDDYLTKMVQKNFGRKDIVVTVDVDSEEVFLGHKDDFEGEDLTESQDSVESEPFRRSGEEELDVEGAEDAEFREVA